MTGEPESNLDDEARAELLTYMVASQLVARATTGEWLREIHLRESADVWCESNGAHCSSNEKTRIARRSENIAVKLLATPLTQDRVWLRELFTDKWRLDYRSVIVGAMFEVCRERLLDEESE